MCLQQFHWKWTEGSPWPPIAYVVGSKLWADDMYESLRQKLASPLPEPSVVTSTETSYVTINAATCKLDEKVTSSSSVDRYVLLMFEKALSSSKFGSFRIFSSVVVYLFSTYCRAGLVHVTSGLTGLPQALAKLQYFAAVVELPEGSVGALHPLVPSIFMKGKVFPCF